DPTLHLDLARIPEARKALEAANVGSAEDKVHKEYREVLLDLMEGRNEPDKMKGLCRRTLALIEQATEDGLLPTLLDADLPLHMAEMAYLAGMDSTEAE